MLKRMSKWTMCLGAAVASVTVSACGAPDFGAMKATVSKPSAMVFLVDSPSHFQTSDVSGLAGTAEGLVLKVQATTSAKLAQELNQAVTIQGLGIIAAVFKGAIPDSVITFAKSHPGIRFEFVGAAPSQLSAVNVKQVVPDAQAVAFANGYLAGEMASQSKVHSVGYVMAVSKPPTNATQAELAGLYDADPTVNLVPATPTGVPPLSIPAIDLSNGTIAASDFKALQTRQAFFVSLDGSQSAAAVTLPNVSHLGDDLAAYTQNKWQPGLVQTVDVPLMTLVGNLVPGPVQKAFSNEVTLMASNHNIYSEAWKAIPQNTQKSWSAIAGI